MYNLMLDEFIEIYSDYSEGKITKDEKKALQHSVTPAKFKGMEEYSYLNDVDSTALKYAERHLSQAFKNFNIQENVRYRRNLC